VQGASEARVTRRADIADQANPPAPRRNAHADFISCVEELSARSAIGLQTATPITNNAPEIAAIVDAPVLVENMMTVVQEF
jgi:hypothetical protein